MPASPLLHILTNYRATSQTEREKGSCFEELIRASPSPKPAATSPTGTSTTKP